MLALGAAVAGGGGRAFVAPEGQALLLRQIHDDERWIRSFGYALHVSQKRPQPCGPLRQVPHCLPRWRSWRAFCSCRYMSFPPSATITFCLSLIFECLCDMCVHLLPRHLHTSNYDRGVADNEDVWDRGLLLFLLLRLLLLFLQLRVLLLLLLLLLPFIICLIIHLWCRLFFRLLSL